MPEAPAQDLPDVKATESAPARKKGAPQNEDNVRVFEAWVEMGRPWPIDVTSKESIAKKVYQDEFQRARSRPELRKKLRDRVRAAIRRRIDRSAT
jgi:hypothetical protein